MGGSDAWPPRPQDFVVQFQVAFSATVKGVGVFAGQPYHCAVTMFKGDPCVQRPSARTPSWLEP